MQFQKIKSELVEVMEITNKKFVCIYFLKAQSTCTCVLWLQILVCSEERASAATTKTERGIV